MTRRSSPVVPFGVLFVLFLAGTAFYFLSRSDSTAQSEKPPANTARAIPQDTAPGTPETDDTQPTPSSAEPVEATAGSSISGQVLDHERAGMRDATITLTPALDGLVADSAKNGLQEPYTTVTGTGGAFSFEEIPMGMYAIRVADEPAHVEFPDGRVVETLDLRQAVVLEGLYIIQVNRNGFAPNLRGVVISPDRAPVPDVEVRVYSKKDGELVVMPATDDRGVFEANVECGPYELVVADIAFNGCVTVDVPATDVTIMLESYMVVLGTVVDARGVPAPYARLTATPVPVRDTNDRFKSLNPDLNVNNTEVDEQGRFALRFGIPGSYEVLAQGADPSSLGSSGPFVVARNAETAPLEIVLHEGSAISGRILDESGAAIPGARVRLETTDSERARLLNESSAATMVDSDETGAYLFELMPACTYTLTAAREDYADSEEVYVDLGKGGDASGVDIVLYAGGNLHGRIFRGSTAMPSQALIFCSIEQRTAHVDANGEFLEKNLPPGPALAMIFLGDSMGMDATGCSVSRNVVIEAGKTTELTLSLASLISLKGSITNGESDKGRDYVVRLTLPGAGPMMPNGFANQRDCAELLTAESVGFAIIDGPEASFELLGIAPGEYDVMVYSEDSEKEYDADGARVTEFGPIWQQRIHVPASGLELSIDIP